MLFLGKTRVLVPTLKVGIGTYGQRQSGTDTHAQKRVGTSTDQSGTDTNAYGCTLTLLSPRFVH